MKKHKAFERIGDSERGPSTDRKILQVNIAWGGSLFFVLSALVVKFLLFQSWQVPAGHSWCLMGPSSGAEVFQGSMCMH